MMALLRHACADLWRRKGRTALTILSVVVGVMLVSAVTVIGRAGEQLFYTELTKMGVDGLSVMAEEGALSTDSLEAIRSVTGVRSAMPLTIGAAAITLREDTRETTVCGIDAGADQVISLELCYGRLISDGDIRSHARVCVVEETYAREVYGRANIVGKTITLSLGKRRETCRIVGVTTAGSALLQGVMEYIPTMVFLPYTTWQELSGNSDVTQVAVRMEEQTDSTVLAGHITDTLRRQTGENRTLRIEDLSAQKERLEGLMRAVIWILTIISGVSLVVSGLGVMTIMWISVQERVREIGIKKAIGATDRRILVEFLLESGLLAALGGGIGLLFGGSVTCIGVYALTGRWLIPWETLLGVWLFTLVIGILSGVFPAVRAARMPPVDALCSD